MKIKRLIRMQFNMVPDSMDELDYLTKYFKLKNNNITLHYIINNHFKLVKQWENYSDIKTDEIAQIK